MGQTKPRHDERRGIEAEWRDQEKRREQWYHCSSEAREVVEPGRERRDSPSAINVSCTPAAMDGRVSQREDKKKNGQQRKGVSLNRSSTALHCSVRESILLGW